MTGRRAKLRRVLVGSAFIAPWLVGFLAFTAWPFAATLFWSFHRYDLIREQEWVGLENYRRIGRELAEGTGFGEAAWNTLYYAAVSVPASVLLGVGLALLLHQPLWGRSVVRTLVYLPTVVPTVATSVIWMWLLDPKRGLVNRLLAHTGWLPNWLNSPAEFFNPATWTGLPTAGSKDGLILMHLWGLGNAVVIYLSALGGVRRDLHEAATLDGAGAWSRFRHVTLPHLSPVIFFNTVTGLIAAMQYFTQAYVVSGGTGGPGGSTRVVGLHVFLWAFKYTEAGYASACAWSLFAMVLVLTLILFLLGRRWVHYG